MSTLAIEGEFSIYRADELKAQLLAALSADECLELDLSRVTEMDCAGLQLVLLARREAHATGSRFRIGPRSAQASEVLQLCGLEELST